MSNGQFYTIFTVGFAAAFAALGISTGLTVLFWHRPVWIIANELGAAGDHLSPLYLALIFAGSGLFIAYWLVRVQQLIVNWLANRAIAELDRAYRDVEQALGTEKADEFARRKGAQLMHQRGGPFDMFGRQDVLNAMAAEGVKIDPTRQHIS